MPAARNVALVAGLGAFASIAFAQGTVYGPNPANASRLLEVDLSPTRQGNYTRPSLADELRFRNAIVTGNTPGGTSFRGDVGYTGERDFRAGLGSDSTFNFRRDSFSSGLGGVGLRGTDALQYQFAYTTGNLGMTNRRGEPVSMLSSIRQELIEGNDPADRDRDRRGGWTQSAPDFGTLRSTASYTSTRSLNPAIVAARTTSLGVEEIVASPLLGLRTQMSGRAWFQKQEAERKNQSPVAAQSSQNATPATSTAYDTLRLRLDQFAGPESRRPEATPTPESTTPPATTPPTTTPDVTRPDPTKPGPGVADPDKATPERPVWDRRMDDLRSALDRRTGVRAPGASVPRPGATPRPRDDKPDTRVTRAWLDDEMVAILRQGAGEVSVFIEGQPRDFYSEHMLAGQTYMGSERYFDAEERFARALSFKPGDPTAMAARVNAELGAGMLISASLNLRELFERHPEVVLLRYTGATIPSKARQDALVEMFRANIAGAQRQIASATRESALLLAYLGWQRADVDMAREGLEFIRQDITRRADPEDKLIDLLATLWLAPAEVPSPALSK